ncbi:GH25 family lysozyme M1 (1,4-beta-N-acetylmuramidase) [Kibdelosporangium banguiense]|uniref:GH25 family lysozyme M1 (1,4-beta-N-acetylmuramidase) n=1 Tax=Kibdelosporangium banguiense TaxID=1365924 RepID=A0ABS4TP63_9PSEU|nr:glycoside hydrolase family 25 protein [Kibdelosporangium banguiense]MBP2325794.1 GH25 family lysozyme M1 (1,4-beta-N-acetylmuramidase) [Kibdelosporangium banguiense]
MALGIDIYRYQTVTDWNAVTRHGVSFVYVKGTDGGGPAIVRADAQVRGAQSVGLPVGLYHYAQLSPSPEVQADVLTAEVLRLDATGLPPALDLEDPHRPGGAARDFAFRFLTRLRDNGFGSVTLYANTSMLSGITADTIGVPGTIVWAAAYGPNDGNRHPLSYRGQANIHQYTSVGLVPGISGRVDLNESLTELPGADMPLTQDDVNRVAQAVWEQHRPHLDPNNGLILPMWIWTVGANMGAWAAASRPLPSANIEEIAKGLAGELVGPLTEELSQNRIAGDGALDPEKIAHNIARKLVERQAAKVES